MPSGNLKFRISEKSNVCACGADECWYSHFSRVNLVWYLVKCLVIIHGGTQEQLQVSLGKLETGWLWAAAVWDASNWMELEDFKLFGILLELNVFGVVGTSYVCGNSFLCC